jgi:cytochrome c-type biogenesis protein
VSVKDLQDKSQPAVRKKVITHTFFFLLGVSTIFLALGTGASFLGELLSGLLTGDSGRLIQKISGLLIVLIGLFLIGFFKFDWLLKERRLQFTKTPAGYFGTIFVGMGFAAGWTPCIGPIFTAILLLAANEPTQGMAYTLFFILGFSLPFFILSFFIGSSKFILRYSSMLMKIGGAVMILTGVLLYTGHLALLSSWIYQLLNGTWFSRLG